MTECQNNPPERKCSSPSRPLPRGHESDHSAACIPPNATPFPQAKGTSSMPCNDCRNKTIPMTMAWIAPWGCISLFVPMIPGEWTMLAEVSICVLGKPPPVKPPFHIHEFSGSHAPTTPPKHIHISRFHPLISSGMRHSSGLRSTDQSVFG